jgi:hypothetical protein
MQRDIHHGLRRRLQISQGVVPVVGSRPGSLLAWSFYGAEGHDPDRRGRGTPRSQGGL